MIITKKYAKRLIKLGKAVEVNQLKPNGRGIVYAVLDRRDLQRTDHYAKEK